MSDAQVTTDHVAIRRWTEARGGRPATVKEMALDGAGFLRIDFGPQVAEDLKLISGESFFEAFDAEDIGFLHREKTADGSMSRFYDFVDHRH